MNCYPLPIGCGREIFEREIVEWDTLTFREFQISGWCDVCQDDVFSEEDEDWPDDYDWNDEAPF